MSNEELTKQIEVLTKRVQELEKNSIQVTLDPTISLYLTKFTDDRIATKATQTYSTSVPSGTAPTGSIWMQDTGSLVTNTIWIYSGSAWIQIN